MRASLIGTFLAVVLTACGGSDAPVVPKRQATPLDPATSGSIRGVVAFEGTPPPMKELPIHNWAGCAPESKEPVTFGDMLVRDGKVENAFVWIKSGLGDRVFAVPEAPVEVDQKNCVYAPRVVGTQVGQPVVFLNSDSIMHNVRGAPKAGGKAWNVSMSTKGAKRVIQLDKPEVMVSVRCDVHPWMQAWVGVVDHPYFATTRTDGQFTLPNVPAGTYTVSVWHERFGTKDTDVTVTAGGTSEARFSLQAPAN